MNRLGTLLLIALLTLAAGCQRSGDSASVDLAPVKLMPAPQHAAWLAQHLPEQTLAYVRLPTIWDGLFAPDASALNNAIGSDAFQQQVAVLQQGIINNILPDLPAEARPALELLLTKLRGPIEVAVTSPNPKALMTNVLIMVQLEGGQASVDQLFAFIEGASQGEIKPMAPMKDGKAMLAGTPLPTFLQFDETSGRLGIYSGMAPGASELDEVMTATAATTSKLIDFERTIDDSGLLPALWIDGSTMWSLAEAATAMAPIPVDELKAAGLDQLDFAWLGFGARQGKGTLRLHLQMPHTGMRQLLPVAAPGELPNVDIIGTPSLIFNLRTPSSAELGSARDWLMQLSEDFDADEMDQFIGKANDIAGFDLADIFNAYGTTTVLLDEGGLRSAGRVRDAAAKQRFLDGAMAFTKSEVQQRSYEGADIHHWAIPSLQGLLMEHMEEGEVPEPGSVEAKVLDYMTRSKTHLFYLAEGDTEIYASVPQALADYRAAGNRQSLTAWMEDRQLDWDSTILGFAGPSKNVARSIYHYYIQGLLAAGDMAKVEIDPFALPRASELGLAVDGRAGIMIDSGPDNLTLRIDYEHNALEPLFVSSTGAMSAVAVIGILAAVAIPAYQDYEQRSKVGAIMSTFAPVQSWVLAHATENDGAWPNAETIAEEFPMLAETGITIYTDEDSNLLMFEIIEHDNDEITGAEFYFEYTDGLWQCSADYIEDKLLPASCR